jgi:HAE1 family hydrophobic/amphiphilic exporter-1
MTSLTTALALVPMAFFGGRGGGANATLAQTILGGVVAATAMTLIVMPAFYCLFSRRKTVQEAELPAEVQ